MKTYEEGVRQGRQLARAELERHQQSERNASLAWHSVHTLMAVVGLTWSVYWWRKRRRRPARP